MTPEQFMKLQKGDVLFHNGDFTIDSVEDAWRSDLGFNAPHTLTNAVGQTIKIGDPWLDKIQIVSAAYRERPPGYIRRLEFVIFGIDEDSSSWTFILDRVEGIIAEYGGYIVEIDG